MGFIHLRSHSYYSFLRGLASPQALASAAVEAGMPALGLTDHHGLSGAIEFHDACVLAGIKPILGLEVNVSPPSELGTSEPGSLVLLAMDMTGWRSLCRISSTLAQDHSVLPFTRLVEETRGLICLTGGRRGVLARLVASRQHPLLESWLKRLGELFPDRLYIELQVHTPADTELCVSLTTLAHRNHFPTVATHDIHYLTPDQAHLQRLLTAIRLIQPLKELDPQAAAPPGAEFLTAQEMEKRMPNFPGALEATQEIGDRCQLELPLGVPHFPDIPTPAGMTTHELLSQKARDGAARLYQEITPD
jgi:DNA polymerase-3 subunit alpha